MSSKRSMKTDSEDTDDTTRNKTHPAFSKSREHNRKLIFVLSLPNLTSWNVLILLSVLADFFLATLCFTLLEVDLLYIVPLFIMFDFLYIFNVTLLLLHRFWRKLSTKLPETEMTSSPIFIADLVSILPQVTLLLIYFRPDYRNVVLYCRLTTCLRMHTLLYLRRMQKRFLRNRSVWFLVQSVVYLFVIIHVLNTAWFLVTRNYCSWREKLWNDNNISTNSIYSSSAMKWYFLTTYLSIQTAFNVGFGDFNATTYCEMFWFMTTMLVGHFFCITVLAVACWLMINRNYHRTMYQQMVSYVKQHTEKATKPSKTVVGSYYQELWKDYHGVNKAPLLNLLPATMQTDVAYDFNCGLIHRSLLFKNLPVYVQRKIALAMKSVSLLPGQPVYYKNVTKKYLVCIERGILEVLYDGDGYYPTISFRSGAILGEVSLFLNTSSKNTVRALKKTDIRILEKVDFMKIMSDYHSELKTMRKTVAKRIDSIVKDGSVGGIASRNVKKLEAEMQLKVAEKRNIEYWSMYKLSKEFNSRRPGKVSRMVTENSALMKIWQFSLAVIEISLCLFYPYYAVFERYVPYDLYVFGIVADVMYLIDVLLQCTTSVEFRVLVKFKDKTVSKLIDIIDIRLDHWTFYCDVFSMFPIEVWAFVIEKPYERHRAYDLLKLNRLLRIWRVKNFLESLGGKSLSMLWVMKNITYTALFTYYVACLLYLSNCHSPLCHKGSWYHQKIIKDLQVTKDVEYEVFTLPTSLYFAIMSIFNVGLGDILPKSELDIAVVVSVILISMVLKTYYTSQLVSCIFLEDFCKGTHETSFYLQTCLTHFQIPKRIKIRMGKYVNSAAYFPEKYGPKFIKNTTELLHAELLMSNIQNVLPDIPLFQSSDSYFIAMLEMEAKTFVLPANEVLYHHGDYTKQMVILRKGSCNLYNSHHEFIKSVGPGTQLGVIEMFAGMSKKRTVVATTDCFMVTIDYRIFSKITKLFPREYRALEDVLSSQWFLKMTDKIKLGNIDTGNHGVIYRKPKMNALLRIGCKERRETYKRKLGMLWFVGFLLMPFTIHPRCLFLKVWCTIRCLMILMTGVALPLLTILPPFADALYWLIFVCQCSLYIDMYILLHISYYNNQGVLEADPLHTARYYITHSFAMDLLAALPLARVSLYFDPSHSSHYSGAVHYLASHYRHCKWQLVHLVQFHRVFKFLSYVRTNCWKGWKCLRIVEIVVTVVLIINVLASLMISNVCSYEFESVYDNTNVETFYYTLNGTVRYGTVKCGNGSWLQSSIFNKTGPLELLLIGVFSVINFLTHSGIGIISAHSWIPMIGAALTSLIGIVLFTYICGILVTGILPEVAMGMDFRKKIEHLMWFLEKNDVSEDLKKKVVDHLKFIWARNRGWNYTKIVHSLNLNCSLIEDVLLSQFRNCLKHCALFHDLDAGSLKLIVKFMRLHHFKKGELVINYKDVVSSIFIVVSGEVQILDEGKFCIDTLGMGTTFGNIQHSTRSCNKVYVKARKNVELCAIATGKLLEAIKYYPHIFRGLKSILAQRSEYLVPHKYEVQRDTNRVSDFWTEIESDEEPLPKKKSSMELINPLAVLKPHHRIFKITDFLTFVASCANVIFVPYVFVTQDQDYSCYLYLVFEPVFFVRIYMKLRRAYFNFYGNFVRSNKKIAQRYFGAPVQVLWDVIPNVPLCLICFAFKMEERFFYYSCMRLLQLLRIYYVLEYFTVHEQKLKCKLWLPIVKMCAIYGTLFHLLSCFWLMMACPFNKCNTDTWIFRNKDMMRKPPVIKLLLSYYYIISTITTTGIKDILPQNLLEMAVTCLIMLLGKLMMIIFIGAILKTVYYSNFDLARYEYKAAILKKHLENQDLSSYQMKRVSSFVKNLWDQQRGDTFPKLLQELPYVLSCDIMASLYGHHLRQNFLFEKIDEDLLRQICSKFQRAVFLRDDYIVKCGDVNSCMYFVQSGQVTVLTEHSHFGETHHVILHANDMFGVSQGFGQAVPHHFTYRATSRHVELVVLPFESWSFLLDHFPYDRALILARLRRESIKT